jgi:ABC-type dipeptide/oligopeptide/nickel transport system permease component
LSTPVEVLPATLEVVAVAAGFIGVMGLVLGCVLLLRETRIAVRVVPEEATHLRNNLAQRTKSS